MPEIKNIYFFLTLFFIIGGSGGIIISYMLFLRTKNKNFHFYGAALSSWMFSQFSLMFFFFLNEIRGVSNRILNIILNDLSYLFLGFFLLFLVYLMHKYFSRPISKKTLFTVDLFFAFMIYPVLLTGFLTENEAFFSILESVKGFALFIFLYYYAFFIKRESKKILNQDVRKYFNAVFYVSMIFFPLMIADSILFFSRIYPFGFSINALYYFVINILYLYIISGYVELPALITVDREKKFLKFVENFSLTPRERDVAAGLTEGLSYREIADKLFISHETVKTHVNNIYKKAGVKNKVDLYNLVTKY